jgi:glucan phosphorylase
LVNGGLNCSILDGWWPEAYSPEAGWAIGGEREHGGESDGDDAHALSGRVCDLAGWPCIKPTTSGISKSRSSWERPAEHFTPRIVPSHPAACIPMESARTVWHR